MEKNPALQDGENVGYLIIRASTARGAIPLPNAAVSIKGGDPSDSDIVYSLRTGPDGLTPPVPLPAPAAALSDTPGGTRPYSVWNIDVSLEGYTPLSFSGVPVFSSVTSVQPAVMIPLPENFDSFSRHIRSSGVTL